MTQQNLLDYYDVLGVAPTADLEVIKKAYHAKAFKYHPDRGGSHAQMILINEAWAILRNLELRHRYDSVRTGTGDLSVREAAAVDVRAARQQAATYPSQWSEFEAWVDKVAGDFTAASYGSFSLGVGRGAFPTAGKNISGWFFILGGAGLSMAIASAFELDKLVKPGHIPVVLMPLVCGAGWIGAKVHQWLGREIRRAKERTLAEAANQPGMVAHEEFIKGSPQPPRPMSPKR